jgi:hypothetical protein
LSGLNLNGPIPASQAARITGLNCLLLADTWYFNLLEIQRIWWLTVSEKRKVSGVEGSHQTTCFCKYVGDFTAVAVMEERAFFWLHIY